MEMEYTGWDAHVAWYYKELECCLADTDGRTQCKVKVNGMDAMALHLHENHSYTDVVMALSAYINADPLEEDQVYKI